MQKLSYLQWNTIQADREYPRNLSFAGCLEL